MGMTPRVYGPEGRERALLPLTPSLSRKGRGGRKGRGSKVCRAASHAASSLFGQYAHYEALVVIDRKDFLLEYGV